MSAFLRNLTTLCCDFCINYMHFYNEDLQREGQNVFDLRWHISWAVLG